MSFILHALPREVAGHNSLTHRFFFSHIAVLGLVVETQLIRFTPKSFHTAPRTAPTPPLWEGAHHYDGAYRQG